MPPVQKIEADHFFDNLVTTKRILNISSNTQSQPELMGLNARLHVPANAFVLAHSDSLNGDEGIQMEVSVLNSPIDFLLDSSTHRFHNDSYQDPMMEVRFRAHTYTGEPLELAPGKRIVLEYDLQLADLVKMGLPEWADTSCQNCYYYPRPGTSTASPTDIPSLFMEMSGLDSMGFGVIHTSEQGRMESRLTLENVPEEGENYVMVLFENSHAAFWGQPYGDASFSLHHLYPGVPFTVYGLSFYRDKVFIGRLDTSINRHGQAFRLPLYADKAENVLQEIQQIH